MRNATMKKVLALILALTSVLLTTVGCGNQENEGKSGTEQVEVRQDSEMEAPDQEAELEPVTLKWYYPEAEKEGTADVIKVFNEKLAEVLPNTTVEFVFVSDYETSWPMYLAGEEEMDIAWEGWYTPFYQDALDGNVIGLTNLINEYAPNLVKEMEIWESSYASCTLDGEVYGIPSIQPTIPESQSWRVDYILEPYLDLEALMTEFHTTAKATEKQIDIFESAVQAAIDDGAIEVGDTSWHIDAAFANWGTRGYISLGNNIYFDAEAENPVPIHFWEIPEVKMLVKYFAKWYDWGWITETQLLDQLPEGSRSLLYINNAYNQNWSGASEIGVKENEKDLDGYEKLMLLTNKPEQGYIGVSSFGSASTYQVIPFTSKNPERAIMLLNILHDEAGTVGNDLMNLLCYGFEENSEEAEKYGWCNYTAVEKDGQLQVDTTVRGDAESKHGMTNWIMGNTYKIMSDGGALTTAASKEYAMNFYTEIYPNMISTALAGMFVDTSDVQLSIENMNTVWQEYMEQIYGGCGGVDSVDTLMDTALEKITNAGLDEVKANLQAQIDAYIAE